jgi:hypothetical protein
MEKETASQQWIKEYQSDFQPEPVGEREALSVDQTGDRAPAGSDPCKPSSTTTVNCIHEPWSKQALSGRHINNGWSTSRNAFLSPSEPSLRN